MKTKTKLKLKNNWQNKNEKNKPKRKSHWHSAGSQNLPFPRQKFRTVLKDKLSAVILLNSTWKLLWFDLT